MYKWQRFIENKSKKDNQIRSILISFVALHMSPALRFFGWRIGVESEQRCSGKRIAQYRIHKH